MGRLYVLILFICLVSSEITAQSYNKFLDKLCDYQDNVRLEEKLVGDREFRDIDTNTFNLKDYMSIFSKLIPEPRYILEYIYNYSWDGGIPLLYARRDDFEEEEYISTERERIRVQWDSIMDVRVEKIENEEDKLNLLSLSESLCFNVILSKELNELHLTDVKIVKINE